MLIVIFPILQPANIGELWCWMEFWNTFESELCGLDVVGTSSAFVCLDLSQNFKQVKIFIFITPIWLIRHYRLIRRDGKFICFHCRCWCWFNRFLSSCDWWIFLNFLWGLGLEICPSQTCSCTSLICIFGGSWKTYAQYFP